MGMMMIFVQAQARFFQLESRWRFGYLFDIGNGDCGHVRGILQENICWNGTTKANIMAEIDRWHVSTLASTGSLTTLVGQHGICKNIDPVHNIGKKQ